MMHTVDMVTPSLAAKEEATGRVYRRQEHDQHELATQPTRHLWRHLHLHFGDF